MTLRNPVTLAAAAIAMIAFAASAFSQRPAALHEPQARPLRRRAPAIIRIAPNSLPNVRQPHRSERVVARSLAPAHPLALAAPPTPISAFAPWADCPIRRYKVSGVGPTCVVRFADGETCRMTTASLPGKPLNAGRGLRNCVAAWRSRKRRHPDYLGERAAPPPIASIHFERDGEMIARFDPADANRALPAAAA